MTKFCEPAPEANLKRSFIRGSGARAENPPMQWLRTPSDFVRRAGRGVVRLAIIGALLAAGVAWSPAQAGGKGDHERARTAVQAGEVLPLASVLERLKRTHPGQVLEVELEWEGGRWVYEIKLLRADGQLSKLELDARTAQVIEIKPRDTVKARPQKDDRP